MKFAYLISATALAVSASVYAQHTLAELTPWGAEVAGNAEGTIPAYTGGLPADTAPPGFKADSGRWPSPFAQEQPILRIDASNMAEHADKLTEGAKELFARFPDTYFMDVYPSHRSVSYSDRFIEETNNNAERCHTTNDGLAVKGCFFGVPFPEPKNGSEMMWNVLLSAKPAAYRLVSEGMYVDSNGNAVQGADQVAYVNSPYNDPDLSLEKFESDAQQRYWQVNVIQNEPARIAGSGQVMAYTADQFTFKDLGWQYHPGQRRTRVIPEPGYDFPVIATGGVMFFDEVNLFTGKLNKYDFELVGKKELYIPYNDSQFSLATKEEMSEIGGGRHPNPNLIRWELHRVWVVDATIKDGERHSAPKRRYYVDEDHHGSGGFDSWDRGGNLYKSQMQMSLVAYDKQTPLALGALSMDFSTGSYAVNTYWPKAHHGVFFLEDVSSQMFTAQGLTRRSAR